MIYNPTAHPINTTLPLSLYYTGLTSSAQVSEQGGAAAHMPLARDFTVELELNIAARNVTWFAFE